MIAHDLYYILSSVYGATGIPFPGRPAPESSKMVAGEFTESLSITTNETSQLSKPLYSQNSLGQRVFLPVTLDGIVLPNPLVSISGKKTIVETPMVGANGSVKEVINIQDYTIKVICTEIWPSNVWPESGLIMMRDVWLKNKTLTIECPLTDIFLQAKDNCVITGISMPDMRGIENAQVYEINLVSDTYFELEQKK